MSFLCVYGSGFWGILIGQGIHQQLPLHAGVVAEPAEPSKFGGWLLMSLGSWVLMTVPCLVHWPQTEGRGNRESISDLYTSLQKWQAFLVWPEKLKWPCCSWGWTWALLNSETCTTCWRSLLLSTPCPQIVEVLTQCIPVAAGVDTIPGEFPCIFQFSHRT